MKKVTLIAASILIAGTATVSAHSNEARFEEQRDAIEQGRRDGSITWKEGIVLRKQQKAIAIRKHELEADGRLSKRDKRELHSLQNEAAATIDHEQNDRRRRLWFLPRVGK